MVERKGDRLYNAAVLVGPHGERGGVIGKYRKMHPWWPPEHHWVTAGDLGYNVFSTDIGNIGIMICYDAAFPEPARCLAIAGADVICQPSNWLLHEGRPLSPDFVTKTRALENHVFFMGSNRIGTERGARFVGRSQIIDVGGRVLAEASQDKDEIVYADIDTAAARSKRLDPEDARSDLWWARRPDTYRAIST
jgi:predicted amidohydrolase